ncbi:MAG: phage tail tape measure protein [Hyphomicrobium sp.]|uniref:phage tail tape measure protein n=1 Tax=Hyphomicrobium sp. TaxID=82 RepID=UPI003D134F15
MAETNTPIETWTVAIGADTSALASELRHAASLGRQFSNSLVGAFDSIAVKGRNVGDVLRTLALRLSEIVLKAALKPLEQGFGNLVTGLLSGGIGFAKGGVVRQGLPVPFASGGIIQAPIAFPLAGGRVGFAGERGAEAIMPLTRGPDGRLGVAARGGAGTSITFNVTAQDAQSFLRSETQVAAMLARAVSLGQRNL